MLKSCNLHLGVEGRRIRSSRPTSATCEFEAPHELCKTYLKPHTQETETCLQAQVTLSMDPTLGKPGKCVIPAVVSPSHQ